MKKVFGALVALLIFGVQPAHAQFAVIDIGAITQLITEVEQLDEQINTAHEHLAQARAAYAAITGGRGMELILSDTVRNYLPEDWAQLVDAMNGVQGAFGVLARDVNATVERNAVLSQAALNDLAPP